LNRSLKRNLNYKLTTFRGSSTVERLAVNQEVAGSNPARGATAHRWAFFIFEFFRKIDIIKIGGQKENKAGIKFIFTKSQYKFSRFFIFSFC